MSKVKPVKLLVVLIIIGLSALVVIDGADADAAQAGIAELTDAANCSG